MSFKRNKAEAIRKCQTENPSWTATQVAAAVGCDATYVYLVRANDRKKLKEAPQENATRGQEILRSELMNAGKTIASMEKLLQESDSQRNMLALEVAHLNVVIKYLERKISGASV
jgi:hypothetical protein